MSCDEGDRFLSGGADLIEDTTELQELDRTDSNSWEITLKTGAAADNVQAEIYCWDLPPLGAP